MDLDTEGKTKAPDISRIGCNWYKMFLSRRPALKPVYCRASGNCRTVTEYFNILRSTMGGSSQALEYIQTEREGFPDQYNQGIRTCFDWSRRKSSLSLAAWRPWGHSGC